MLFADCASDLRLYRENSTKKANRKEWECVCLSLSDWCCFLKQFRKTSNCQEKELYVYLNYQLFPLIENQLQELSSKEQKNKIVDNTALLNREREELEGMLENKYNCSSGDCSGTVTANGIVCDTHNGKSASAVKDFLPVTEDQKSDMTVSSCDDSTVCGNTIASSSIDVKPNIVSTTCVNTRTSLPVSGNSSNNTPKCNGVPTSPTLVSHNTVNCLPHQESAQDAIMQSLSNQSCESSVSSNKENTISTNPNPGTVEIPPVSAMVNMVCSATTTISTISSLPPTCNNTRTTGPLESQYSQQQSQIFVFSTSLANKAAESVISGQYPSVIAYHCSQPGTKYFLEKHPLRIQQFNRQNSSSWCSNISQTKQSNKQMKPGTSNQLPGHAVTNNQFHGLGAPACCSGPCNMHGNRLCNGSVPHRGCVSYSNNSSHMTAGPGGMNIRGISDVNNPPFWPQQHYPQNMIMGPCNRFQNPIGGPGRCMDLAGTNQHGGGNMMASIITNPNQQQFPGVKVPDESLTPQQRQHREEQLAMIRKMHQLLFPDQHRSEAYLKSAPLTANMPNHARIGTHACSRPRLEMYPHESCIGMMEHRPPHSEGCFSCVSPGMTQQCAQLSQSTFQMEWQKMQQQYSEDKTKKPTSANSNHLPPCHTTPMPPPSQNQLNTKVPSPSVNGNNSTTQGQPFSAPYNQASHGLLPGSHPASPCSGSLVNSPSSAGVVNSPADTNRQFNHPTPPCSRVPHPSPGPGNSNSLHATPLSSPSLQTSLTSVPTPGSTPASTPTNPVLQSPNPSSTLPTPSNSQTVSPTSQSQVETSVSVASVDGEIISSVPGTVPGDSPFRETIQKCNQKQPSETIVTSQNSNKEPSLMPVPSPQQIHYMNTFDGQELTIQKQPNTTMSEQDSTNSRIQPNERIMSSSNQFVCSNMSPHQAAPLPQVSCSGKTASECEVSEHLVSVQSTLEGGQHRTSIASNQIARYNHNQQFQGPPQNIQRYTAPSLGCDGIHHMNNSNMMQINGMEGHVRYCGHIPQASASPVMTAPVEMMRCVRPRMSIEQAQRFRGPSPHITGIEMMQSRYSSVSPHLMGNENVPSPYGNMTTDVETAHNQYCNSGNSLIPLSRNGIIDTSDTVMGSTHLQNLQKMAPPFDSPSNNKIPVERTLTTCTGGEGPPVMSAIPGSVAATATQQGTMSRLSHFDPISSVPAISDSPVYQPLGTSGIGPEAHQHIVNGTMNMTSIHMAANSPVSRVNFQTNSQTMHGVQEVSGPVNLPCHQFTGNGQVMQDMVAGPQTVNNTYVNATMSIQQLNIQNATTSAYSANGCLSGMNHQTALINPQNIPGPVAHTVSSSATSSHPIVHSAISPKVTPTMSPQMLRGANIQQQAYFSQQFGTQRPGTGISPGMVPRTPGVASLNGPNIQVKVNTPNTIQYMPIRQQNMLIMSPRASGLEMMQQRFPSDGKFVSQGPQYYSSSGQIPPNNIVVGMIGQDQGMNSQRCPVPNGGMGQMYSGPSEISPYVRHPMPNEIANPVTMNNFGTGHGTSFLIPSKQMLGSSAVLVGPEASQPLPPTVGQSLNYKQSAFYGLTPADPNYAVQFHNFQQQLYATNTRGQVNTQNNASSGQGFFGTK